MEEGKGRTLPKAYTYDAQGERLTQFNLYQDIGNRTFDYDEEDRLLRAGDATYTYDVDGFLTQKVAGGRTTSYVYSSRGETKEVDLGNGTVVSYDHDVMGRPVAKLINNEVVEKYLWAGRTRLLAVYNADDSLRQRFEYGNGRLPMAMDTLEGRFYLVYDQMGSLRAVADGDGNIVKTVSYDSFGNIIADSNPAFHIPFGFAGGLHDRDTGLVRFGFRDYDPVVGRWTAKDPIGFEGGLDVYGYAAGSPVQFNDPNGLIETRLEQHVYEKCGNDYIHAVDVLIRGEHRDRAISFFRDNFSYQMAQLLMFDNCPPIVTNCSAVQDFMDIEEGERPTGRAFGTMGICIYFEHAYYKDAETRASRIAATLVHEFAHYAREQMGGLSHEFDDEKYLGKKYSPNNVTFERQTA